MSKQFSVSGAVAVQSEAHARMEKAIATGTTWKVLFNGAPYVTCSSYRAAVAFVGKSKRYTIVQG